MLKAVVFDLDGTLLDTIPDIAAALNHSLAANGLPTHPAKAVEGFVGGGIRSAVVKAAPAGSSEAVIEQVLAGYHDVYVAHCTDRTAPYPGVEDMLRDLRAAGKRLLVATSKPEVFALRIMEHFGLAQYFDHICGAPMDNQEGAKKAAVIRDALRRAGVEDLSTAVMVGDRRHDIDGARQAGLEAVGVLWGYGDLQELEASHPVHIVESFDGLKKVLI